MDPLQLINLMPLMEATSGKPEIVIGIIDGPVESSHPDLKNARLKAVSSAFGLECTDLGSHACMHGTFVAGIICGRRGSYAPAISPNCSVLVRPIFSEETSWYKSYPKVPPNELAAAIVETVDAGARIINLSMGLSDTHLLNNRELKDSFDYAFKKRTLLIAASGNQGRIGHNPLFNHPWVIPVVACDSQGHLEKSSNIGPSVGKRGIMAPGVGVISTCSTGRYIKMSGTSMAAPFVTGTAALLWSLFPKATALDVRRALLAVDTPRKGIIPPLMNAEVSWSVLSPIFNSLSKKGGMSMEEIKRMEEESHLEKPLVGTPKVAESLQNESHIIPAQEGGAPPVAKEDAVSPPASTYTEDTIEEEEAINFIYALGTIQARFPSLDVEKEFAQAAAEVDTADLTNMQTIYKILTIKGK